MDHVQGYYEPVFMTDKCFLDHD